MATINNDADSREQQHRIHCVAADTAVIILLFSTMFSSWTLAAVAGGALIALLFYAWSTLQEPVRQAFVEKAIAAAVIALAIGAAIALISR